MHRAAVTSAGSLWWCRSIIRGAYVPSTARVIPAGTQLGNVGPMTLGGWLHGLRRNPRRVDAVLAAVLGGLSILFSVTTHIKDGPRPGVASIALILLATIPLVWRRRHPIPVLGVVIVAEFVQAGLNYQGTGWVALIVAAYSMAAWGPARRVPLLGGVTTVLVAGFVTIGWLTTDDVPWQAIVSSTVVFVAAVLLGDNVRRRREASASLLERAERAEHERQLMADQQVRQERARLARELHDVVAHSVSLMTIQAAGARRQLAEDPARAERAMVTIEETGRQAMTEMRRILGVLRDNVADPSTAPQPHLDELDALVAGSGLPAALTVDGDLGSIPPGVELSAYRIVQEAITNVRRHAGLVHQVEVRVQRVNGSLTVEVLDDGRGAAAEIGPTRAGHGLIGMRERVTMLDGTLAAGPRPGGGWRVAAVLPVTGA